MSDQEDINTFPEKLKKLLGGFTDEADAMSEADLRKIIVSSEGSISKAEKDKAEDVKLKAAKEKVKDFSLPYTETIKYQTAKIKYAVWLLENRGIDLGNKE